MKANSKFLGDGILGPFPTEKMWTKTWSRERNKLYHHNALGGRTGGKYGSATDLIANVKAGGVVLNDWLAGRAGTILFSISNAVNTGIGAERFLGERQGLHAHFQLGFDPTHNFYKTDIFIKQDNPFGGNHKKRRFGK
jgi:hypothetical protein